MKRLTKLDIVAILILFALGLSTYQLSQSSGIKRLKLINNDTIEYLSFTDEIHNLNHRFKTDILIEVKGNAARISHSNCFGKQCIKTGWIDQCGESAICIPNKTAIQIECDEQDIDAISQ